MTDYELADYLERHDPQTGAPSEDGVYVVEYHIEVARAQYAISSRKNGRYYILRGTLDADRILRYTKLDPS